MDSRISGKDKLKSAASPREDAALRALEAALPAQAPSAGSAQEDFRFLKLTRRCSPHRCSGFFELSAGRKLLPTSVSSPLSSFLSMQRGIKSKQFECFYGWMLRPFVRSFRRSFSSPFTYPNRREGSSELMAGIRINRGTDTLSSSKRLGHSMSGTSLNSYAHVLNQADARSSGCIADTRLWKEGNRKAP